MQQARPEEIATRDMVPGPCPDLSINPGPIQGGRPRRCLPTSLTLPLSLSQKEGQTIDPLHPEIVPPKNPDSPRRETAALWNLQSGWNSLWRSPLTLHDHPSAMLSTGLAATAVAPPPDSLPAAASTAPSRGRIESGRRWRFLKNQKTSHPRFALCHWLLSPRVEPTHPRKRRECVT